MSNIQTQNTELDEELKEIFALDPLQQVVFGRKKTHLNLEAGSA